MKKNWRVKIKLDKETPEDIKYKNLWQVYDALLNSTKKKQETKINKI